MLRKSSNIQELFRVTSKKSRPLRGGKKHKTTPGTVEKSIHLVRSKNQDYSGYGRMRTLPDWDPPCTVEQTRILRFGRINNKTPPSGYSQLADFSFSKTLPDRALLIFLLKISELRQLCFKLWPNGIQTKLLFFNFLLTWRGVFANLYSILLLSSNSLSLPSRPKQPKNA